MWSTQRILNLIEDIRCSPCLWDMRHTEYRNRPVKQEAYDAIARKYGVSAAEIAKKFQILRTQFRRELKRVLSLKKPSQWFGYEPLMFLNYDPDDQSECTDTSCKCYVIFNADGSIARDATQGHNHSALIRQKMSNVSKQAAVDCLSGDEPSKITHRLLMEDCSFDVFESDVEHTEQAFQDQILVSLSDCESATTPNSDMALIKSEVVESYSGYDSYMDFENSISNKNIEVSIVEGPDSHQLLRSSRKPSHRNSSQWNRDEYSVYGEHIANKLRSCGRNRLEIAIAQHEIDNICFKLTMGGYKEQQEDVTVTETTISVSSVSNPANSDDVSSATTQE